MVNAYQELQKQNTVKSNWEEDQITDELYNFIQITWKEDLSEAANSVIPKHQSPKYPKMKKKGRAPTIDIVFKSRYFERRFLCFECKLVAHSNRSQLVDYIREGMMRYINEKYSNEEPIAAMIGYTFENAVDLIVNAINNKILKLDGLTQSDKIIEKRFDFTDFANSYFSRHSRKTKCPIELIHMFFTFGN